jgi:hypothetical protein
MSKVATVQRGATGQVTVVCLVHPEKFALDAEGEAVAVRTVWLPIDTHINNGEGAGFYLKKGFIDPAQFIEFSDYKEWAKANKAAAKAFQEEALEDEVKQKARFDDEEAEKAEALSADHLRHVDKENHPGDKMGKEPGKALRGVTKSGQGVG